MPKILLPKKKNSKLTMFTVRLDIDTVKRFRRLVRSRGITMQDALTLLMNEALRAMK